MADLAFYGTFVTPSSDVGQRRTADITSGFSTANWGKEYIAFGAGGARDAANLTTERVRINATGVSIGTGAPTAKLQVNVSGAGWLGEQNGRGVIIGGTSATVSGVGQLAFNATNAYGANIGVGVTFGGNYSTVSCDFGGIWGRKETTTSDDSDGYLQFNT